MPPIHNAEIILRWHVHAVNNSGFRARPELLIGLINVRMNGSWTTDYCVGNVCLRCVRVCACVPICVHVSSCVNGHWVDAILPRDSKAVILCDSSIS